MSASEPAAPAAAIVSLAARILLQPEAQTQSRPRCRDRGHRTARSPWGTPGSSCSAQRWRQEGCRSRCLSQPMPPAREDVGWQAWAAVAATRTAMSVLTVR